MILELMIIAGCAGESQYRDACKKSAEAASKQTELYSFISSAEKETERRARIQIYNYGLENVLAAGLIVNKVIKDKGIEYTFKSVAGIDDVGVNAGLKGAGLGLHWSLD